jgi:hypothetical protein
MMVGAVVTQLGVLVSLVLLFEMVQLCYGSFVMIHCDEPMFLSDSFCSIDQYLYYFHTIMILIILVSLYIIYSLTFNFSSLLSFLINVDYSEGCKDSDHFDDDIMMFKSSPSELIPYNHQIKKYVLATLSLLRYCTKRRSLQRHKEERKPIVMKDAASSINFEQYYNESVSNLSKLTVIINSEE